MLRMTSLYLLFIFIFFSTCLYSKNIEADYSVEFGIVGEVGKVHAVLSSDGRYYMIDANVSSVGIARAVTDDLEERHISKGHVENGLLVTDMYQMIKSYGDYTSTTIYRVNHSKRKVTRQYKKWKFDKQVTNRTVTLDYYGKDDLMTFFLNLPKHIENKYSPKKYQFKAIGEDRKNGRVDITIPSKNALKEIIRFCR